VIIITDTPNVTEIIANLTIKDENALFSFLFIRSAIKRLRFKSLFIYIAKLQFDTFAKNFIPTILLK